VPDIGFLARYAERITLDLGDGYWIRFRRFLLREDFAAANDKLFSPTVRIVGESEDQQAHSETSGALNTSAQQDEYVARALDEWNLTDEENRPIPLGTVSRDTGPDAVRYAAVRILPEEVFDQILAKIEGTGGPKRKAKAVEEKAAADRFPVTAGAGAEAGAERPA
jgi:hypothetical protein